MSQENVQKFFQMIADDPEFKQKVQAATSTEEMQALLKAHNLSFSKEAYEAALAHKESLPLNEEELANLSAGAAITDFYSE